MSIEINGLPNRQIQDSADSNRVTADKPSAKSSHPATTPTTGDQFSLTSTASQLQKLTDEVKQLPVVDADLVAEVQRSVVTGSFQFEPVQAADNLLTQERELASLDTQK
jgi:negative regulator of flagellin synthesis FlgM